MIDAEVLAEYRTTIEDLEKRLRQAKFDVDAQIGYYDSCYADYRRMKRYWKQEQAKNQNFDRWRQSL